MAKVLKIPISCKKDHEGLLSETIDVNVPPEMTFWELMGTVQKKLNTTEEPSETGRKRKQSGVSSAIEQKQKKKKTKLTKKERELQEKKKENEERQQKQQKQQVYVSCLGHPSDISINSRVFSSLLNLKVHDIVLADPENISLELVEGSKLTSLKRAVFRKKIRRDGLHRIPVNIPLNYHPDGEDIPPPPFVRPPPPQNRIYKQQPKQRSQMRKHSISSTASSSSSSSSSFPSSSSSSSSSSFFVRTIKKQKAGGVLYLKNVSCHRCKSRKKYVYLCPVEDRHRFCKSCLERHHEIPVVNSTNCPLCRNICTCSACLRKRSTR